MKRVVNSPRTTLKLSRVLLYRHMSGNEYLEILQSRDGEHCGQFIGNRPRKERESPRTHDASCARKVSRGPKRAADPCLGNFKSDSKAFRADDERADAGTTVRVVVENFPKKFRRWSSEYEFNGH